MILFVNLLPAFQLASRTSIAVIFAVVFVPCFLASCFQFPFSSDHPQKVGRTAFIKIFLSVLTFFPPITSTYLSKSGTLPMQTRQTIAAFSSACFPQCLLHPFPFTFQILFYRVWSVPRQNAIRTPQLRARARACTQPASSTLRPFRRWIPSPACRILSSLMLKYLRRFAATLALSKSKARC